MNFPNVIRYLLLSLFLVFLWSNPAAAQSNTLSGQILMPSGVVPVSSSATFRIQTVPLQSFTLPSGEVVQAVTTVTIPRMSSSAQYSIALKDSPPSAPVEERQVKVKFDCITGCGNIAITSTGFLGGVQGVVSEQDAVNVDSGLSTQVDIQLERADLFSGLIQLPSSLAATGNEVFTVSIVGSQFLNPSMFSQTIRTVEGDTRWSFFVGVPASETGGGWTLRLDCQSCNEGLVSGPYFPTTSSGDPLSTSTDNQFFFRKDRAYSNIRLSLPRLRQSVVITPVISLLLDD